MAEDVRLRILAPHADTFTWIPALPATSIGSDAQNYDFPILPATAMGAELALAANELSLSRLVRIVECDPVAMLRLFALTPAMCAGNASHGFTRTEERLAALEGRELRMLFGSRVSLAPQSQAALVGFAQQTLAFAQCCREVASALGLHTEEAYLVGLLSDVWRLPALLQLYPAADADRKLLLPAIAQSYQLPQVLLEALLQSGGTDAPSLWRPMLHAARELTAKVPRDFLGLGASKRAHALAF